MITVQVNMIFYYRKIKNSRNFILSLSAKLNLKSPVVWKKVIKESSKNVDKRYTKEYFFYYLERIFLLQQKNHFFLLLYQKFKEFSFLTKKSNYLIFFRRCSRLLWCEDRSVLRLAGFLHLHAHPPQHSRQGANIITFMVLFYIITIFFFICLLVIFSNF